MAEPSTESTGRDDRPAASPTPAASPRWELIRDLVVFQLKLAVDALRDVALIPLSLAAGVIDLVAGGNRPGRLFYGVLRLGSRTEIWINLFGEADPDRLEPPPRGSENAKTVDSLVARVEEMIVEQVERGGVTAAAKEAIDRSLDAFAPTSRQLPKENPREP